MLESVISVEMTPLSFLLCTGTSLILGLLVALCFSFRTQFTKGFAVTVAIIPAVVQIIIMMVSGNIGAGVWVAGTFSLIRFRSEVGSARQIGALFLAVALGIICAKGYLLMAVLFFLFVTAFYLVLTLVNFGEKRNPQRDLRITIPESLDYEGIFDDLFSTYTNAHSLDRVKTTNMGTLYELRYTITLKDETKVKSFLDEIRTRNGNLTVICGRVSTESNL